MAGTKRRTPRCPIVPLLQAALALMLFAMPVSAQNEPGTIASFADKSKPDDRLDLAKVEPPPAPVLSNDRLFYALPNFLTVDSSGSVQPLTSGQKFRVVARSSFDYVAYPWYAFRASISQAEDNEPAYGQGAAGYGKRLAVTFADCTVENFMVGAVLPSVFRQDPRFYRSGQGGFWHRTGYAVSRMVITRGDSGREQFNFSEILGSALAAGISTYTYHPAEDRTLRNAATGWGTQVGFHTFTIAMREFWPDLHQKISRKIHGSASVH